jgi:dinuclear metal center YbgI/SA1388 family protein
MPKVIDFYQEIDRIAPFRAACSWDNVGLQVGELQSDVAKVLFTLDVTDAVVDIAITEKVNLIISHHPLIFPHAIKSITHPKLLRLIKHDIAVIVAHTNLDMSRHGINTTLADKLGLSDILPLCMSSEIAQYQVSVYVPAEHFDKVLSAMHVAGAGVIGNYRQCATYFDTSGLYCPIDGSKPFQGKVGHIEYVAERKIEVFCEEIYLQKVISQMCKAHPYETPAYSVVPLSQKSPNFAMGCFGSLSKKMSLSELCTHVKESLDAPTVRLWLADQTLDSPVQRVALCGGSGSSIISEARAKADVYVSGDFTYHQLLDAPLPVIDAGHFYTENPGVKKLSTMFSEYDCEVIVIDSDVHDISKLIVR